MIVGIYHPAFWTSHGHWGYQHHTQGSLGIWNGISYRINSQLAEADFVVVHEDIDQPMNVKTSAGGLVLVTGEEKSIKQYHPEYLNQFDLIITSRDDLKHPNIIRCHYLNPWRVKKTYDELIEINHLVKTKMLSSIISNLTALPSHKERFAFINKLKGHYKDDLDWFSKGEHTFIEDKWDGLEAYRYSIAIENSYHSNYFTEKITDCFLAYAMPFYAGCPNIKDFFDERSFVSINTKDFKEAIETIDLALRENVYEKNLGFVKDSRRLVLEKYHFIAALTDILHQQKKQRVKLSKTILPQVYFKDGKVKRLLKSAIKKMVGK